MPPDNKEQSSAGKSSVAEDERNTKLSDEVPQKYLNSLGFVNYDHYGRKPWVEDLKLSPQYTSVTHLLGIDCEMVGVGHLKDSALGRVSIINEFGYCIYDQFVNPMQEVTDYRTQFSGIRDFDILYAPRIDIVLKEVESLVRGNILVGHSIHNDLEVLKLKDHPLIRDTALYFKRLLKTKKTPSLRELTEKYLKIEIQSGEHSSILDAQATMKLYLMHKEEWEISNTERLELANIPTATITSGMPLFHISDMHVAPREPDLYVDSKTVFIRPNKVVGRYSSCEEYKDVQFRLLLEDFFRQLREGVNTVKRRGRNNRSPSSKLETLFHNVSISAGKGEEVKGRCHLRVPIETNNLKDVDWNETKIFLNGSLLLLTPDNFRSVKFAVIQYRPTELLPDSHVIPLEVVFSMEGPTWIVNESHRFLMMESSAFYEAYKHTLEYLQVVNLNEFPLKPYIVDVKTDARAPFYMRSDTRNNKLDFSVLMKNNSSAFAHPLDFNNWPPANELTLDESQYEALQKAITQEVTIIQGPPGTGKTFIGVQIVKLLLSNPWILSSPILIVSYTNHSLDQTLEQILEFVTSVLCKENSRKAEQMILRIGGGSKSDIIQPLTLMHKEGKHSELMKLRAQVDRLQKTLDAVLGMDFEKVFLQQGILNFESLPKEIKQDLASNDQTQPIYSKWKEIQKEMQGNPKKWFGFEKESSATTPSNLNAKKIATTPAAKKLFLLECSDIEKSLEPFLSRIKTVALQKDSKLSTRDIRSSNNGKGWQLTEEMKLSRWAYYVYLVKKVNTIIFELTVQMDYYKEILIDLEHYSTRIGSIRVAKIIGMTTTGAVKYKKMVEKFMKPKIMIVEEAAHVLEAHVVSSLTKYCEQMIMIGDHKQLRPLTANNNLAVEYNLDVSLMERLVQNGIDQGKKNWIQLKVQHRMRPEIARMVCPVIYEELENHPNVNLYPKVNGCSRNIFFVDHDNTEGREFGSSSTYNQYEARFLVGLVKYFVNNDYYKSSQITVIVAYLAQKILLDNEFKNKMLHDTVRVSTVDGYQGEENDIILLSLVRNNTASNVGFLKTDNRVCVALSRARHGLFMIGNMSILKSSSDTWKQINEILQEMGCIGKTLPLTGSGFSIPSAADLSFMNQRHMPSPKGICQRNHQKETQHRTRNSPKTKLRPHQPRRNNIIILPTSQIQGTQLPRSSGPLPLMKIPLVQIHAPTTGSTVKLPCGHMKYLLASQMKNICNVKCLIVVKKKQPCGHHAKMPCNQKNFTCTQDVRVNPPCKHSVKLACNKANEIISKGWGVHICKQHVNKELKCGHFQSALCSQTSEILCKSKVMKSLSCGHTQLVPCHQTTGIMCREMVKNLHLPCGHKIKGKFTCCTDVSNIPCKVITTKTLPCGHNQAVSCYSKPSKVKCTTTVKKNLPCGHVSSGHCHQSPGTMKCNTKVLKEFKCGHQKNIECHLAPTVECNVAVTKIFPCGHEIDIPCHQKRRNRSKKCPSCPQNQNYAGLWNSFGKLKI